MLRSCLSNTSFGTIERKYPRILPNRTRQLTGIEGLKHWRGCVAAVVQPVQRPDPIDEDVLDHGQEAQLVWIRPEASKPEPGGSEVRPSKLQPESVAVLGSGCPKLAK